MASAPSCAVNVFVCLELRLLVLRAHERYSTVPAEKPSLDLDLRFVMTRVQGSKRTRSSHRAAGTPALITSPTREDAEKLLARARNEVRRMMRSELEADRISTDLMNFRMKA